jgi:phenylpropionate dioxygenase-like ring-hydroxylating dioxygenase large terminal subunit
MSTQATPIRFSSAPVTDLASLISSQPKAHSLKQDFYRSPDVYRLEIENLLWRRWHCVGHQSSIPNVGDYFLFEIDTESVIIIRGEDKQIRALMNVCRHRGSRVCEKQSGNARGGVLVCPYHAWVYKSDGSLRNARMMPSSFDASSHGLKHVSCKVIEGLIFVAMSDDPLATDDVESVLAETAGQHGWADAKVIAQAHYVIDANWKLALENQVECYHCGPSHPEFSRVHSQGHKDEHELTTATLAANGAASLCIDRRDLWAELERPGQEAAFVERFSLYGGAVTASEDGKPVAPLMSRAGYDGMFTIFYVGQLNHFLAYSDYGALFRYTPRSETLTDFYVTWLVRPDAQEGVDFDPERVSWLWRVTAAADKRIVEGNQVGVNSRFYEPGPYAEPSETKSRRMVDWYLNEMMLVAKRQTDR